MNLIDAVLRVVWGDTPESWFCVDCGVDTAPGWLGRNAMIAAYRANGYTVPDIDSSAQSPDQEVYTVRDVIWWEAGKPSGCLCIGCLETRLGRALTPHDFADARVNWPSPLDSPRLRARLVALEIQA